MHAYLIILEITPLKTGSTYDMLPLHCTLVHWFWLKQEPEEVAQRLTTALNNTSSVVLKAGAEQVFTGKNKNGKQVPVTVNDIELTSELRNLHDQVCATLEDMDVRYSEPQYVHEGFHPHVTHQKDGQLSPGETRKSAELYLVEAAAPEYGNERTIRSSVELMEAKDAVIDDAAKLIWDYMQVKDELKKADAIFALCSLDTRVAERAAQLYLDGFGEYLIFSGSVGKLTEGKFTKSEAATFADIALDMGVPQDKIILEDKSTNTGQNIQFTYDLLKDKKLSVKSLILVQKPYMERRTYATFKKQWPDATTQIYVTSPQIPYEDYFNETCPKDLVLNIMVGDLQRIKEYPKLGYQIAQEIPDNVWAAFRQLVDLGFKKHLIK